ncbi:glycosyl transferase [Rhodococcoides trifolii]|uniref:Glycosyl transferase n=1 Tax=Rhodococcoides trifolii TaxID=908250 RepID=A0A917G9D9_9NOCA|nr:WecB/TagA/CpsF family glycosyltransferase [Rhodococcus trifolii]GGG29262.1 glycosyl transferase [Rhodococcus trifolii]
MTVATEYKVPGLDVSVSPMHPSEVIEWIDSRVGQRTLMLNHNLHSAYLFNTEPEFRQTYELADLSLVDGFPILVGVNVSRVAHLAAPLGGRYRTGSCDWIDHLTQSKFVRRVAVIGTDVDSNRRAARRIAALDPRFVVEMWDGFGELEALRRNGYRGLHDFRPDLILLGLGMPLQERLIRDDWDLLPEAVIATVGGALDQLSGTQAMAPRYLGRCGMEWLYRLASDPRRLSHRYLVEPFLLGRCLGSRLRHKVHHS